MSGGVDSSYTAYLLDKEGYNCFGVTMLVGENPAQAKSIERAGKVAGSLGIPHHVIDLRKDFEKLVIKPFVESYAAGITPNPCIVCNPFVKFGLLMEKTGELGAGFFATGHYVRKENDPGTGRFLIRRGKDDKKDQSYFLYRLSQEQLGRAIFPLGGYTKVEVKKKAAEVRLPLPEVIEESQEICFVPGADYQAFIRNNFSGAYSPGPILDEGGKKLGEHKGLPFYTVGQRKGLGISAKEPLFILKILPGDNAVIVGPGESLLEDECEVADVNWIIQEPDKPFDAGVRPRYKAPASLARIIPLGGGRAKVVFEKPQRALTPGQSAVFYDGDLLLGGGVIQG